MADFSHLDGQIGEAANTINEAAREVTQTREQRVNAKMMDYDSPALAQTIRELLSDEKYILLERVAYEAKLKAAGAASIPTGPFVQHTPQEAALLNNENELRADWGKKELGIEPGSRNHYIYEAAAKNGVDVAIADRLIQALDETVPKPAEQQRYAQERNRGGYIGH